MSNTSAVSSFFTIHSRNSSKSSSSLNHYQLLPLHTNSGFYTTKSSISYLTILKMSALNLYRDVASTSLSQRSSSSSRLHASPKTLDTAACITKAGTSNTIGNTTHSNLSYKNKAYQIVNAFLSSASNTPIPGASSTAKEKDPEKQIDKPQNSTIFPYLVAIFIMFVILDFSTATSTRTTSSLMKYFNSVTMPISSGSSLQNKDVSQANSNGFSETSQNKVALKLRLYSDSIFDIVGMTWENVLVPHEGFQFSLDDRFEIYDIKSLSSVAVMCLISVLGLI